MWKKAAAMSATVRDAIGVLAGPRGFGDTRESWLARAASKSFAHSKKLGGPSVSFRMMRSLWNGEISEATQPDHWAVHTVKQQATELQGKLEAGRLAATYERVAEGMRARNADYHRDDIDALVRAARILRGEDRPGIDGGEA
jgi:hypothetical protein